MRLGAPLGEVTPRRLDHLVHATGDLDRAALAYRRLGFEVTPRSDHPFGTSNRLVVLEASYIELISVTRPELVPPDGFASEVAARLRRGPGLSHLVLGSDDARLDHAGMSALDLARGPVVDFERLAHLAGGAVTRAAFSLVLTTLTGTPGVFLCQHHTPEAVWDPSAPPHPNGATRVAAVGVGGIPHRDRTIALSRIARTLPRRSGKAITLPLAGTDLTLGAGPDGSSRIRIVGASSSEAGIEGVVIRLEADHER